MRVREVLENSRPSDVILKQRQSMIDVHDYSTLAFERCVNSFAIHTICLCFLQESKLSDVVYVPCYSQIWVKQEAQYFKRKVSGYFYECPVDRAKIILAPIHFENNWGLVCFDIASKTVSFDDGLKIFPPRDILSVLKNMLSGLEILSNNSNFKLEKWNRGKLCFPLLPVWTCQNRPQQALEQEAVGMR